MKVTFTAHAAARLRERAHMTLGSGKSFVRQAAEAGSPTINDKLLEKYKLKNPKPNTEVIGYKHLMFVVEKAETRITVITVLVLH